MNKKKKINLAKLMTSKIGLYPNQAKDESYRAILVRLMTNLVIFCYFNNLNITAIYRLFVYIKEK